jgi:hypothetical protein
MMGDAYRVAKQAYDKKDKTMTTRDAGLTKEQVGAAEVHAAGSSHCGEIKSKSAFSRDSTVLCIQHLGRAATTPKPSKTEPRNIDDNQKRQLPVTRHTPVH